MNLYVCTLVGGYVNIAVMAFSRVCAACTCVHGSIDAETHKLNARSSVGMSRRYKFILEV